MLNRINVKMSIGRHKEILQIPDNSPKSLKKTFDMRKTAPLRLSVAFSAETL